MAIGMQGNKRLAFFAILTLFVFALVHSRESQTSTTPPYVNAFFVRTLPQGYPALEAFFASLRNTGANTLIIDLPMTEAGFPAMSVIPNAVYLAHQSGLHLYVILPTRKLHGPISQQDNWEDLRYDPATETYQRTGKLDLFHQPAVDYLSALAKELSAFSVDAVLLGNDFTYSPIEGMGRHAVSFASSKLGSDVRPAELYRGIEKGPDGPFVRDFTELFQRWTAIKRDRLISVYQAIRKSAVSANNAVKVGIPIPMTYPVMNTGDIFTQYAQDMSALRSLDVDYFWAGIEYRELRRQQGLTYRQTMELASRLAHAAATAAKDASRTIIIVPMTDEFTSKGLPYSEVEEITALLRQTGETGIAYGIKTGLSLNREFTNKLFRRQ